MTEEAGGYAILLIAIGAIVITSVALRWGASRIHLPAMIGYLLIGVGLGVYDENGEVLSETMRHGLTMLADIGLVVILFRVGLESDLESLFRVLRKALAIFAANFLVAGALGFAAIMLFTDFGVIAALFAGAALSATSVGVSTAIWRDAGALDTESGALLIDVAELDDISAIIVIGLLFALAPSLNGGAGAPVESVILGEFSFLVGKLGIFLVGCYLFTRYLEEPLVKLFRILDPRLGPMLFAFGVALLVAAMAELAGFSFAIGAMFAGLAFSTPPTDRLIDRTFEQIHVLFAPFFFISIGLATDGTELSGAVGLGALLLGVAIIGKLLGAGVPVALLGPRNQAWLFGMSMVPRAEIALIVMSYGLALGPWAVPPQLYNAMVLVSFATCVIAPIAVTHMLRKSDLTDPKLSV